MAGMKSKYMEKMGSKTYGKKTKYLKRTKNWWWSYWYEWKTKYGLKVVV